MLKVIRRGFTLIELMIVIAIIAVLAVILVPNFIRARADSFLTACEANEKNIATAVEMYGVDNSGHFPQNGSFAVLTPNYLKVIPTCPAVSLDTYSASYQSVTGPDFYSFFCSGTNHLINNLPTGFPQYNSSQGLIVGAPTN